MQLVTCAFATVLPLPFVSLVVYYYPGPPHLLHFDRILSIYSPASQHTIAHPSVCCIITEIDSISLIDWLIRSVLLHWDSYFFTHAFPTCLYLFEQRELAAVACIVQVRGTVEAFLNSNSPSSISSLLPSTTNITLLGVVLRLPQLNQLVYLDKSALTVR
jgi:hypothetical protein